MLKHLNPSKKDNFIKKYNEIIEIKEVHKILIFQTF